MSDSDESRVTYMEISSTIKELSDIGSPGVVPSPDYILGPEEPQSPPPLDYVPEPIYPEYMPQEDEVFSEEEQPLPAAASPTAQSPDYVPESGPEADPEEDNDEDPKKDPVDYPVDGGDDGDDEEGSLEDDEDDDMDIEADDDDEEEEHPAPADSIVVALPAMDQAPSAEETESFETDESAATPPPHPAYRVTARISIPAPVPTPVCITTTTSVTTTTSINTSTCVISITPASPIRLLGYRAAMIRLRAEAASTSYSLPLPPPLHLLSTYRESSSAAAARPARGLRANYGFVATIDRETRHDPERDVGYGITDSVKHDTDKIYMRLDDEQSGRQLLAGRLNMLFRDRRAHARTARLMETEARMSREAWGRSIDASDLARVEVMSLRTTVLAQQSQIRELQIADHRRQTVISELLATDYRRQR
ncbi:hypothetical protein Tco_1450479 [Tanacetum coccineum]